MNPNWMSYPGLDGVKTPAEIEYDAQQRLDRERRIKLHEKAVERRKKAKKHRRRSQR